MLRSSYLAAGGDSSAAKSSGKFAASAMGHLLKDKGAPAKRPSETSPAPVAKRQAKGHYNCRGRTACVVPPPEARSLPSAAVRTSAARDVRPERVVTVPGADSVEVAPGLVLPWSMDAYRDMTRLPTLSSVAESSEEHTVGRTVEFDSRGSVFHTDGFAAHMAGSLLVPRDVRSCLRAGFAASHERAVTDIVQVC